MVEYAQFRKRQDGKEFQALQNRCKAWLGIDPSNRRLTAEGMRAEFKGAWSRFMFEVLYPSISKYIDYDATFGDNTNLVSQFVLSVFCNTLPVVIYLDALKRGTLTYKQEIIDFRSRYWYCASLDDWKGLEISDVKMRGEAQVRVLP